MFVRSPRQGITSMFSLSGRLYRVDQVPGQFRELFILSGYRHPKSSAKQCILSAFDVTNETLNIWTHFLPAVYFAWWFVELAQEHDFVNDPYTWPLLVFTFSSMGYLLASAIAHTFNTMSNKARHIFFFLDYAALSNYSLGAAIAFRAYCFPEVLRNMTFYSDWYVRAAIFNSVGCTVLSCQSRFMAPGKLRKVCRLGAFVIPFSFDVVPLVYRMVFAGDEMLVDRAYMYHTRQLFFAFLAGLLYASHMPERLLPGKFDYVGHSHQLFHIAGVLGNCSQMTAILYDMLDRKDILVREDRLLPWSYTVVTMGVVTMVNLITIFVFSTYLTKDRLKLMSDDKPCNKCH
ncbi:membrane progestin receptor gamma isoform X2 [Lingula anatina]|uniref:Membrane progestin receptor gamma isoform X2 n=1 Tax=Lingula anatina TaxID=7574 RepID=A0A1S3HGI3_LINAN|nr:membrane progestin receptor gamma isoform X2 [Lingula anatina]|eukprot:XP_013384134.1 membrane progestin receptor gamma isoform X2 [Lingula anatina]